VGYAEEIQMQLLLGNICSRNCFFCTNAWKRNLYGEVRLDFGKFLYQCVGRKFVWRSEVGFWEISVRMRGKEIRMAECIRILGNFCTNAWKRNSYGGVHPYFE